MKGKIITTYLGNSKNIPNDYLEVLIMRKPFGNIKGLVIERNLGPLEELHDDYIKSKNWDKFSKQFEEQLETDTDTIDSLNKVLTLLDRGRNIALVCCEKDYLHCHRYIEGLWFKNKGVEVSELQGKQLIEY